MFGLETLMKTATPVGPTPALGLRSCSRPTGLARGLVAGTRIATANEWRPVEALAPGDLILTFDRGVQPLRGIFRGLHCDPEAGCPARLRPLRVPAGALGNAEEMTLLSEQHVLVESDAADILFGDPFSLICAADLEGFRGIERSPHADALEVMQLQFETDEVVFAERGGLAFCPAARVIGSQSEPEAAYVPLPRLAARDLVECLRREDALAAANPDARTAEPAYAAAFG